MQEMSRQMYDVVVTGSGPAGLSAALYLKRAGKNVLVVEKDYEGPGQIAKSICVENYPGLPSISGEKLGEAFRNHVISLQVSFLEDEVTEMSHTNLWQLKKASGEVIETNAVIYAAGAIPKKLGIPGEEEYQGRGISFCAYCDGSLYRNKDVAVVGGGDTALDDALYLSGICRKVYLLHRRADFRGRVSVLEKLKEWDNVEIMTGVNLEQVSGQKKIEKILLDNGKELTVSGLFIAIGSSPESDIIKSYVRRDSHGYVIAGEDGMASVAFASGMAAISNAFLNILQSGNEIVTSASLYGGTIDLFWDLEAWGIHTVFVENNNWQAFEEAINERTRLIFAETIGNPGLDVTDIWTLADLAHAHQLPLIIDNTTATSYLIQPLKLGADIVVNSSSKYINGNSSAISGILTDGGRFRWKKEKYPVLGEYIRYGPMAYIARMRATVFRNLGACLSPQNSFLNLIGIETLGLRMERQCQNAMELASWLQETYPELTVNYPGLKTSPWNEIARKEFTHGYGAIFTIRTGSRENAFALINHLRLALRVSNIGDTKTLVIHPASTISLHSTERQKEEAGVYEDLIRVSVGIEDINDLKEDFRQAIAAINHKGENKNGR